MRISDNISYHDAGKNGKIKGLISRVQSETDKGKRSCFGSEKALCLKGEYDSVSDEMGSIYYKVFQRKKLQFVRNALDRIRKNLEEWQKSRYLYQRSDSEHEYRHFCCSGNVHVAMPQQRETLAYD